VDDHKNLKDSRGRIRGGIIRGGVFAGQRVPWRKAAGRELWALRSSLQRGGWLCPQSPPPGGGIAISAAFGVSCGSRAAPPPGGRGLNSARVSSVLFDAGPTPTTRRGWEPAPRSFVALLSTRPLWRRVAALRRFLNLAAGAGSATTAAPSAAAASLLIFRVPSARQ
jgi:hypothetical protein